MTEIARVRGSDIDRWIASPGGARRRGLRVAHLMPWTAVYGTEIATRRMAEALVRHGVEHVMLCPEGAEPVRAFFAGAGFDTATCALPRLAYRRPWRFARESIALARELRRRRADVLHCADLLGGYLGAVSGRLAGIPVLCHVRNAHATIDRRYRPMLRAVSRFAFVSHDTWLRFGYPVDRERGVVVYDGVDEAAPDDAGTRAAVRAELGLAPAVKVVGMVARIAEQKDHATFLRAAARIARADGRARFLVVGDHAGTAADAERARQLVRLASELGLDGRVVFTGFRADAARVVSALDVAVLATHAEGFGLAVAEAMAAGKPVVATAVGGLCEIVEDGVTGLLHRHGDDAHLASQVLPLLADEDLAARLAARGQESVRRRFARARCAADLARVYVDLVDGRPAPSPAAAGAGA